MSSEELLIYNVIGIWSSDMSCEVIHSRMMARLVNGDGIHGLGVIY